MKCNKEELIEFLKVVDKLENVKTTITIHGFCEEEIAPPTPPSPEPPPPGDHISIEITKDKRANAHYAVGHDGEGKPIMAIYPDDHAPVGDRIQYEKGSILRASPDKVKASGGAMFYLLLDEQSPGGDKLYIKQGDARVVTNNNVYVIMKDHTIRILVILTILMILFRIVDQLAVMGVFEYILGV